MTPTRTARVIGALTAARGAAMVASPSRLLHAVNPDGTDSHPRVVQVLGARSLLQGVTLLARPTRGVLLAAGATDLLHASTMFALAAARQDQRRAALTSAILATSSGLLGLRTARRMHP